MSEHVRQPRLTPPFVETGPRLVPGQILVKLAPGEAPEGVPALADVRLGVAQAARSLDGGPIDRMMRRFSDHVRIARVHTAAAGIGHPGKRHQGFDDVEHALGMARTFRVEIHRGCSVHQVTDSLRQLAAVEAAMPQYLATLPFRDPTEPPAPSREEMLERAWRTRSAIRAQEAMSVEPGDPALIVSVVDTGVELDHPELQGQVRPGWDSVQLGTTSFGQGIEALGDWSEPDPVPNDEVGHGTSCTSIIAGLGRKIPPGIAGDCGLLPVRVLGSARFPGSKSVTGVGALSDIDAGVKTAIDLGGRVLNMSFGTAVGDLEANDPRPHEDVVRYGLARGCVMVAASGNSGKEETYYPAASEGVIAVGAVDGEGRPSEFSTRGSHVALSAPGEQVLSAGLQHSYIQATGTSFAAPFVTAVAALIVSHALRHSTPVDSEDVEEILRESARPWPEGEGKGMGAGILDGYEALRVLERRLAPAPDPETSPKPERGGERQ